MMELNANTSRVTAIKALENLSVYLENIRQAEVDRYRKKLPEKEIVLLDNVVNNFINSIFNVVEKQINVGPDEYQKLGSLDIFVELFNPESHLLESN